MFCPGGVAWVIEVNSVNCILKVTEVRAVDVEDEKHPGEGAL